METVKSYSKKTFEGYDNSHMAVYFNERELQEPTAGAGSESGSGEGEEQQTVYEYDVVLAECHGYDKGAFVNAIIRSRYTESDELAIQRHYANSKTTYKTEWEEYNAWCEQAKVWATEMQPVE